jgi:tetratricopeptide (TPR) repeat protein
MEVVRLSCPSCGAAVSTSQKQCEYCKNPVVIVSFSNIQSMPMPEVNKYANAYRKALAENPNNQDLNTSIAMCYLRLKLYDKALPAFEKAMEDNFDNSETFFYAAVCLLKGQKAFVAQRSAIDKIEEYLNAALMIEPKGIYYYFLAYVKHDYFHRKYLNTSPDFKEALEMANASNTTEEEVEQLFTTLCVNRPDWMAL